jgi:hypothetical protein
VAPRRVGYTARMRIPSTVPSVCARLLCLAVAVIASVLAAPCSGADLPDAERDVLLALYRATDGAHWDNQDGWSTPNDEDSPPCTWHGVVCEEHWAHVHKLVLDTNNLSGELPADLAALTELRALSLNGNRLAGAIPSLAGLRKLEYLSLSRNALGGPFPMVDDLGAMASFHVDHNRLEGPLPSLAAMPRLQFFDASSNALTGALPPLAVLRELKMFSVSGNHLDGKLPAIAGMPLLHDLFVDANQFEGTLPALDGPPELRYFRAAGNRLSGAIPDLAGAPNLQELDVAGNRLSGVVPAPAPRTATARLCPNDLSHPGADAARDAAWNTLTKTTPWWRDCR